jgi:Tol biopolymer transport system component
MSRLDDRLTRELERAARPAGPTGVFERVDRKRARRAQMRRVRAGSLAVLVIAGTVGGFAFLSHTFKEPGKGIGGEPQVRNGAIVYSEVRNAGQHLWVAQPDGTGARQLTTGEGSSDYGPSISPDGSTVAFTRTDQNGSAIYTIGMDGGRQTRLVGAPAMDPTWSPDGSQIAFAGSPGGPYGIYLIGADGSNPRIVDGTGEISVGHPTWSPDGGSIAFEATAGAPEAGATWDIYTAPVDGSGLRNLSQTPNASEISPVWSPDGSQLAFVRDGSVWLRDIATGDETPLTSSTGRQLDANPSWSPDGQVIAFDRTLATGTSLMTMRADGSGITLLASNATDPAWQSLPTDFTSSPVPTATPTIGGPLDLGLAFPVCNPRPIQGDFDGDGQVDTATVVTKMSDVSDCPAPNTTTNVVVLDTNGDGKADASIGPIACDPSCDPYASPDLNGDGRAELVVDQGHLASPVSASLSVYELSGPLLGVWTLPDGSMTFDVSDAGSVYMAGAFCSTNGSGQPLFTIWEAPTADGGATYDLVERNYRIDTQKLRFQLDSTAHDTLTSSSPWPENPAQTNRLCGAPVTPLG